MRKLELSIGILATSLRIRFPAYNNIRLNDLQICQ